MTSDSRPPVSVIVPFAGGAPAARELIDALRVLDLVAGDEILLADNARNGALGRALREAPLAAATVVGAAERRSSYLARNAAAARADRDWLLFLDADCLPAADLVDAFFAAPPGEACGAVAGAIEPLPGAGGLVARYTRARGHLDQAEFLGRSRPFAATANLLVRRSAWEALGGFSEVRSGGDVDFSWRLQDAGWEIEHRPGARVRHRHRERLVPLLRQQARYGRGAAWLARAHPGARELPRPLRGMARSALEAAGSALRGRWEEAAFRGIDALVYLAYAIGARRSNEPAD